MGRVEVHGRTEVRQGESTTVPSPLDGDCDSGDRSCDSDDRSTRTELSSTNARQSLSLTANRFSNAIVGAGSAPLAVGPPRPEPLCSPTGR